MDTPVVETNASVRAGKHLFATLSRRRRPASGEPLGTMDGTRFGPGGQMELRYLGSDQLQNARTFRFEVVVKGATTMQAVVVAEMALFLAVSRRNTGWPELVRGKIDGSPLTERGGRPRTHRG